MNKFRNLFGDMKPVIAMIHIGATPQSPGYKGSVKSIIDQAVTEAKIYENHGIKSVMIENMHDVPYLNREVGHEVAALMGIIGYEIKKQTNLSCGIQILAGANIQAMAAAKSADMDFIRAESYVFSHIADEGIMHSDAGQLKRYQKQIDAEDILIFTDIKKKHSSHSITDDIGICETAKAAEFFLSDGIIITGTSTGKEVDINDLRFVGDAVIIPKLIGSGISTDNLKKYYEYADGFIVGSYFKKSGYWANPIDETSLKKFMEKIRTL